MIGFGFGFGGGFGGDLWGDPPEPEPNEKTLEGLLVLLNAQADLLISVATGGARIDDVNVKYRTRRRKLTAGLGTRGIPSPFPYEDLWAWYEDWSSNLSGYGPCRVHITKLAAPAREALEAGDEEVLLNDPGGVVGVTWAAFDARVEGVATELHNARTLDDLQDVGRRCREILIDTARLLSDPALVPAGRPPPKAADAKAWLDLFLAARSAGRSHRELRAFLPAAWDLAQKVTHGEIGRADAYAAAQATVLIVHTLQQIVGANDPSA